MHRGAMTQTTLGLWTKGLLTASIAVFRLNRYLRRNVYCCTEGCLKRHERIFHVSQWVYTGA